MRIIARSSCSPPFSRGKYKERRRTVAPSRLTFTPSINGKLPIPSGFRLNALFLKTDNSPGETVDFYRRTNNVRSNWNLQSKIYAGFRESTQENRGRPTDICEFADCSRSENGPQFLDEILLHNLADPSHSLIVLENKVTAGMRDAKHLLIDLKNASLHAEKWNRANIGAAFKCTTIPILRKDFGCRGMASHRANYLLTSDAEQRHGLLMFKNSPNYRQLAENILIRMITPRP